MLIKTIYNKRITIDNKYTVHVTQTGIDSEDQYYVQNIIEVFNPGPEMEQWINEHKLEQLLLRNNYEDKP